MLGIKGTDLALALESARVEKQEILARLNVVEQTIQAYEVIQELISSSQHVSTVPPNETDVVEHEVEQQTNTETGHLYNSQTGWAEKIESVLFQPEKYGVTLFTGPTAIAGAILKEEPNYRAIKQRGVRDRVAPTLGRMLEKQRAYKLFLKDNPSKSYIVSKDWFDNMGKPKGKYAELLSKLDLNPIRPVNSQ